MGRYYGINIQNTDLDYVNCSDEQFINEAELHGLIWENTNLFIEQLNNGHINPNIVKFRYI
jgi:hypothetical protein